MAIGYWYNIGPLQPRGHDGLELNMRAFVRACVRAFIIIIGS